MDRKVKPGSQQPWLRGKNQQEMLSSSFICPAHYGCHEVGCNDAKISIVPIALLISPKDHHQRIANFYEMDLRKRL